MAWQRFVALCIHDDIFRDIYNGRGFYAEQTAVRYDPAKG